MLVTIEDDDCTCTLCGEKLPSEEQLKTHKMHCSRKRQVQRHNGIRDSDAVATMINADIRSRHLDKKYYVTRESAVIGKKPVAKSSTSFSDIRSDITIPAAVEAFKALVKRAKHRRPILLSHCKCFQLEDYL